jgi:hypothetical protein
MYCGRIKEYFFHKKKKKKKEEERRVSCWLMQNKGVGEIKLTISMVCICLKK